ncbi:peptidylprolyl isomerase [Aminithiophilus ramosus]|uniref:Peptidyl-prolyl cis-trans isomerase n=2 Tax=Synergistales TaxID=649776 RepID=A0A9Q7EZ38_9BACT|nr:peptidylprolyl isomerase [Aminithiophilus ramosus]QTX32666.1 peptidylprolyl isomerase [Aminithiophilus ramosus]QVL36541.1 peptidylprolyl isomerase [Synergistota bacterium]
MKKACKGDRVRVHYRGTLVDGREFDNSWEREEPIEFVVGDGRMIAGFDGAVEGLAEGERKGFALSCKEAYGPRHDEMLFSIPRENFPQEPTPEIGQNLQMRFPDGQTVEARITSVGDATIVLDGNHPLAGEDLHFEVELVEIVQ